MNNNIRGVIFDEQFLNLVTGRLHSFWQVILIVQRHHHMMMAEGVFASRFVLYQKTRLTTRLSSSHLSSVVPFLASYSCQGSYDQVCARPDQFAVTMRMYYMTYGSASLGFLFRRQEFLIPVGIILKLSTRIGTFVKVSQGSSVFEVPKPCSRIHDEAF